jgi:transposase-like protein
MVKCPYCSNEYGLREVRSWRFRFYTVKRIQCPKCNNIFNHYYGSRPNGRVSEFTIRVKPRR